MISFITKLPNQLVMIHNRSRNQLRKESHIRCILQKIVLFALPAIGINHIRELLKRIKTNAKRQHQPQKSIVCLKPRIDIFNKKVIVFVIKQNAQIYTKSRCKQQPAQRSPFRAAHQLNHAKV